MGKNQKLLIPTILAGTMLFTNMTLATCPSGMTPNATGNCSKSVDGCDDGTGNKKCSIEYTQIIQDDNTVTYDMVVKPKSDAAGDIILQEHAVYFSGYRDNLRNVTIEEGITGLATYSISSGGTGTLKLPSTLTSMGGNATYAIGFTTIDVSDVKNLQSGGGGPAAQANTIAINGAGNLQNLIVSEDSSPISFGYAYNGIYPDHEVKIQCKGDPNRCQNLIQPTATWFTPPENFSLEADYYVKTDEDGRILEKWNGNGVVKFSYDGGGNMVRQTDEHGNVLWARRIYTLEEANAVAGTKNRISIRYK